MEKYTIILMEAFYRICEKTAYKRKPKKVALGLAVIGEADLQIGFWQDDDFFTDEEARQAIISSFNEMVKNRWIAKASVDEEDKPYHLRQCAAQINRSGISRDKVKSMVWPFGDDWFTLTRDGLRYIMRYLVRNV